MTDRDFINLTTNKDNSIIAAMKQLDDTAEKNLYVINDEKQLIGSLSDGDIRRALLKGISTNEKIETIMNSSPKYVINSVIDVVQKAKQMMLDYQIESICITNLNKQIVEIIYWVDIFEETKKVKFEKKSNKVFILAGGLGTRLEPFTKILPKPLIPFGDKPILETIMDKFTSFGFDEFIISLNYKGDMIKLYFGDNEIRNKYSDLQFVKENSPLGTIGSLYLAEKELNESFFITNSDIIIYEDMIKILQFHKESKAILTLVGCMKNTIIPYGVLNIHENGNLICIDEKPKYNHVINTGVYVAEPEILTYLEENKKMDITDLINIIIKEGKKISIYPIVEEHWIDIGQWAEYKKSVELLNSRNAVI